MVNPESKFQPQEFHAPVDKPGSSFTGDSSAKPKESRQVFDSLSSSLEEKRKVQAAALDLDENASYEQIHRVEDKNLRMKLVQELGMLTDYELEKMAKGKLNISWKEIYVNTLGLKHFRPLDERSTQELIHRSRKAQNMFDDKGE